MSSSVMLPAAQRGLRLRVLVIQPRAVGSILSQICRLLVLFSGDTTPSTCHPFGFACAVWLPGNSFDLLATLVRKPLHVGMSEVTNQ